jgi:hypothetical protein
MIVEGSSRAGRVIRRLLGLAAPALLVGLIVVTQALGRTSATSAQAFEGPGAPNVKGLERTVNRLIKNELADLRFEQRLFKKQDQTNLRLFTLDQKLQSTNNKRQIHFINQQINRNLTVFNRYQAQLNFNKGALIYDLAVTSPYINRELAVLGQISSSVRVAQFVLITQSRQQAIDAALTAFLSRPPATPFHPF